MSKENPAPNPFLLTPKLVEQLPPSLLFYADRLGVAGYENLTPLLDRRVETRALRGLKDCLTQALTEMNPSSQVNQRIPEEAKQIRERVEELMQMHGLDHFLETRVIEPEALYGFNAPYKKGDANLRWDLSDFGKAVLKVTESYTSPSIFLIAGRAREAAGTKSPASQRKEALDIKSYRMSALNNLLKGSTKADAIPDIDFDLLVVSSDINFHLTDLERLFGHIFKPAEGGWVKVLQSERRPDFSRVEIGIKRRVKYISLGHAFPPGMNGNYDFKNLLLPFLMENFSRADIPILLIPFFHQKENQRMIWGLAVDFFTGFGDIARHRLEKQSWLEKNFAVAFYPFPEISFSLQSPAELLFRLGYVLRTLPWGLKQPIVAESRSNLTQEELEEMLENETNLRRLSKQTQDFFTNQVIYPLRKILDQRSFHYTRRQRLKFGLSLLEDIALGLDGDPVATLLRLLPAGVSFTKSDRYFFATNINIYGFGIFDENGLFPEIGKRLTNADVLKQLKAIIYHYVDHIEGVRDDSRYENYPGKKLFFDFLFELAGGDSSIALELLRPAWCDKQEWDEVRRLYQFRLVALDERFGVKLTLSRKIEQLLSTARKPITAAEIALSLGLATRQVHSALMGLEDKGRVIRFGGWRGQRGEGERGMGVGGGRVYFILPGNTGRLTDYTKYMSPEEKLIWVLERAKSPMTITDLIEVTGVGKSTVGAVIHRLLEEGKLQMVGFKDRHKLWQMT